MLRSGVTFAAAAVGNSRGDTMVVVRKVLRNTTSRCTWLLSPPVIALPMFIDREPVSCHVIDALVLCSVPVLPAANF